ncbi:MAG: cupin domain-containing protein [Bacteroidales bacterium]|nr:cupin domain-containing protein [Candidatus Liminaster caballi]
MKKSLKDIQPIITSHAVGEKRVLLSRDESGCGITQIAVTDLRAGEVALAHIHPDMQEGFYVLEGDLDVTLNDDVHHCHKDDFVYVESGTAHELHAITDVRVMTIGCEIKEKKSLLYPMVFKPNLHSVVWGGQRIKPWKGIPSLSPEAEPVGESWEVSAVPSSPSIVDNGHWTGMSLIDVISQMPEEILGRANARKYGNKLPLLVKFIDAEKDLSIQVHPDDQMAMREHGKMGKTEMWYVIDAKPGAYLYAGFKDDLTSEQYAQKVSDGSITDALAKHEVNPGDVFYLPAGRVHAICGGILLAEVQQTSDVTYRIFDYNRPGLDGKPRQLHTELAAEALDFKVYDEYRTDYAVKESSANHCIDSPFFNVRIVDIDQRFHRNLVKYDSFIITMCLKGSCHIKIRSTQDEVVLHEGNSCLIPAAIADYDVEPISSSPSKGEDRREVAHTLLLDAFVDNKDRSMVRKATRFFHISKL